MVAAKRARVADTRKVLIRRRLPRGLEDRTPRECVLVSPELLRTERRISVKCTCVVAESRNEVSGTSLNRMRHRTASVDYARSWASSPVRTLPTGQARACARQQPPSRGQESILPDDPITPCLGNAGQAVERTGELSGHRRDRIGIVGQVGREQHGSAEVGGAGDRPDGGFEGVDDVPAGADRVP